MTREEAITAMADWTGVRITELSGMWTVRGTRSGVAHAGCRADLESLVADLQRIAREQVAGVDRMALERARLDVERQVEIQAQARISAALMPGWEAELARMRAKASFDRDSLATQEMRLWEELENMAGLHADILAHAAAVKEAVRSAPDLDVIGAISASLENGWP